MIKNRKKGVTLIEVMVAMGIFSVISAMAIAIFVATLNLKTMSSNMKESQQKLRISLEMVSRLARQANKVVVTGDRIIEIYYDEPLSATKFSLIDTGSGNYVLRMFDCVGFSNKTCISWNNQTDLISNPVILNSTSRFEKVVFADKAALIMAFNGRIEGVNFTSDTLNVETEVILENE